MKMKLIGLSIALASVGFAGANAGKTTHLDVSAIVASAPPQDLDIKFYSNISLVNSIKYPTYKVTTAGDGDFYWNFKTLDNAGAESSMSNIEIPSAIEISSSQGDISKLQVFTVEAKLTTPIVNIYKFQMFLPLNSNPITKGSQITADIYKNLNDGDFTRTVADSGTLKTFDITTPSLSVPSGLVKGEKVYVPMGFGFSALKSVPAATKLTAALDFTVTGSFVA